MNVARARPAEATGFVTGPGLAGALLALGHPTAAAVAGIVAGALPSAVTLLVRNGGLRGVARALWRGRG